MASECADSFGAISVCTFSSSGFVLDAVRLPNVALSPRQQLTRLLHRDDRVLERRRRTALRDRIDLLALFRHAGFKRRREVFVPDLVERRQLVGQRAFARKRIVGRQR